MKQRDTIDKWSLGYWALNNLLVKHIHDLYYRKIQIQNIEKIPHNVPIIIAPNHQNALMDALAIVCGVKFQTVFLARADIFKGKLVSKILTSFKMLPVYRIRDGRSKLQKNDEIFDITQKILRNKINPLCLFPEGNHGDKRRLRPLVKGIFRIAFQAQEDYKSNPGVKIIPTGIDYQHYQKFRQTQLIVFGDPIDVSDYWDEYSENPAVGINKLRDRLADEMKKLMIDIETEEYYDLYLGLRSIYNRKMCRRNNLNRHNLFERFLADKEMIDALNNTLKSDPEEIKGLNDNFQKYTALRNKLGYRDWVPFRNKYNILLNCLALLISIVALPFALFGLINNWPHYFIPPKMTRNIKDPQFLSTAKWGTGFVIMLIYYILLTTFSILFLPVWWAKLLYIFTLPLSGIFSLNYRNFIIKTWARIRYSWNIRSEKSDTFKFKHTYDGLTMHMDQLMEEYLTK